MNPETTPTAAQDGESTRRSGRGGPRGRLLAALVLGLLGIALIVGMAFRHWAPRASGRAVTPEIRARLLQFWRTTPPAPHGESDVENLRMLLQAEGYELTHIDVSSRPSTSVVNAAKNLYRLVFGGALSGGPPLTDVQVGLAKPGQSQLWCHVSYGAHDAQIVVWLEISYPPGKLADARELHDLFTAIPEHRHPALVEARP